MHFLSEVQKSQLGGKRGGGGGNASALKLTTSKNLVSSENKNKIFAL